MENLKIKDVREFRKYYKEKIRRLESHREENFIGNTYLDPGNDQKRFGWFEIYHGDKEGYAEEKDGIKNFLQSFLDMAKDGQAVYEFLQNAVDAGSTHFTMIWGEDEIDGENYLLVANNGDMFSFDNIRSILNVGSSTKTAHSETIGKFGIGFKLAHRLVGADNGLDELVDQNKGPILFSWENDELCLLAEENINIDPQEITFEREILDLGSGQRKELFKIKDNHPWLFKILMTCFPCLPDSPRTKEEIRLINYELTDQPLFSTKELKVLSRWVKKNLHLLNKETYKKGALFFIKLGKGKENELADINLKEGVRFSLAILNQTTKNLTSGNKILSTVQLNGGDPIKMPELEYCSLIIKKTEDDYAFIRYGASSISDLEEKQFKNLQKEDHIEILFGFRKYETIDDFFKGAPNFYLFFPLSEEVHNFNFILHSNAFYKASSRTFLHKGGDKEYGINERLLKKIVERLEQVFQELSSSESLTDRRKFLDLYAAILTSRRSFNQDRQWIEEPFIKPLHEVLKKFIPVRTSFSNDKYETANSADQVYFYSTDIEIDLMDWVDKGVKWFYWSDKSFFRESATDKLRIEKFGIKELLEQNGIAERINN